MTGESTLCTLLSPPPRSLWRQEGQSYQSRASPTPISDLFCRGRGIVNLHGAGGRCTIPPGKANHSPQVREPFCGSPQLTGQSPSSCSASKGLPKESRTFLTLTLPWLLPFTHLANSQKTRALLLSTQIALAGLLQPLSPPGHAPGDVLGHKGGALGRPATSDPPSRRSLLCHSSIIQRRGLCAPLSLQCDLLLPENELDIILPIRTPQRVSSAVLPDFVLGRSGGAKDAAVRTTCQVSR